MKCKNCGCVDFVKFGDHYECTCCGLSVKEEDFEKPIINYKNNNEIDSLVRILEKCLGEPRFDEQLVSRTAGDIIKIEPENMLANFFLKFIGRNSYPENYITFINDMSDVDFDEQLENLIIPFMINHSEYKYFDSITNMLIASDLYSKYNNMVYEAKKKIESDDEDFSNIARDVFICYSSNNLKIVKDLVSKIEKEGITCWYFDRNVPKHGLSQADYKLKIEDAISKTKVFLVIMSTYSMLSDDAKRELDIANKYNIQNRIEYRIEEVENTAKFRVFFQGIEWIDASNEPQETKLLDKINDFLHPTQPSINYEDNLLDIQVNENEEDPNIEEEKEENEVIYESSEENIFINSDEDSNETEIIPEVNETIESNDDSENDDSNSENDVFDNVNSNTIDENTTEEIIEAPRNDNTNEIVLSLFENEEYKEAFDILDKYDELPDNLENLVYYYIGYCFEKGYGTNPDYERMDYFYRLAKTKNPTGSNENLGKCFFNLALKPFMEMYKREVQNSKSYVDPNNDGYELLNKAVNYGNTDAMVYIGLCYKYGIYVEKSLAKAFSWFKKSADAGSGLGAFHLGKSYEMGLGVAKDETLAYESYLKSAMLGNDKGMVAVGICYYYGKGAKQSYQLAAKYYKEAADLGNSIALYNLAQCYIKGHGVNQDDRKAFELMKTSAELDNISAKEFLDKKGVNKY